MSLAACAPVSTGSGFLKGSLDYLDCAGRSIGSIGYQALTQPGSAISQLVLAAITLFIAWHGIRMMFGRTPDMGEAVLAVAKIGLVLMLVTSWPAVRTVFAEPSFAGSAELASQAQAQGSMSIEDRLQRADDGIVALTKWGTGKLDIRAGRTADGLPAASEFAGIALTDNLALGLGRIAFLVSSLLSLGLLKLLTGVMISALPIFAGLLLFDTARGVFIGWLRLIFALFVAGFAVPLILTVELAMLEPWLGSAIEQRSSLYATPSAPTELLALSASFLLILTGSMALLVRSCLSIDVASLVARAGWQREAAVDQQSQQPALLYSASRETGAPSRAEQLAYTLDRMDRSAGHQASRSSHAASRAPANDVVTTMTPGRASGTRRRARQRVALSHSRRNSL